VRSAANLCVLSEFPFRPDPARNRIKEAGPVITSCVPFLLPAESHVSHLHSCGRVSVCAIVQASLVDVPEKT
jgi:hypothetical protein